MGSSINFRRGQVWFVNDNFIPTGSIQGKSRPYVVVSNDTCNKYSPVIHMAPITSQHKKVNQPTHVQFFNPRKKQNNWILLEQTMPKSVPDIEDLSDYEYTLSAETMKEVDKALLVQFGLQVFGTDISDFETMLDLIVEQKIAQIQEATQSLMDSRMAKYVDALMNRVAEASKLPDPAVYVPGPVVLKQLQYAPANILPNQDQDVADPLPSVTISPASTVTEKQPTHSKSSKDKKEKSKTKKLLSSGTKVIRPESAIDRFNAKWGTSKNSNNNTTTIDSTPDTASNVTEIKRPEIIRLPSGSIRWTEQLKRQFIDDTCSYDREKVADIWSLSPKAIYSYKSRFSKELNYRPENHVIESSILRKKRGRPPKSKNFMGFNATRDEMIIDYDEMPISRFMEKYNIPTRSQAVEIGAKLKTE